MNKRDLIRWAESSYIFRDQYDGALPYDIWYIQIADSTKQIVSKKLCQKLFDQGKIKEVQTVPTKANHTAITTLYNTEGTFFEERPR